MRPLEASGTSGMKPPPNGGLNLSVLDGWWDEAWNGRNGWAIGEEIKDGSMEFQNEVDAESLYSILENQVTPLFYARPDGRLPLAWLQLMRDSMRTVTPQFNTHRMVEEYTTRLYEPAATAARRLASNSCLPARALRDWKEDMRRRWHDVRIEEAHLEGGDLSNVPVGSPVKVVARVHLGEIKPEYVLVQACLGHGEGESVGCYTMLPLSPIPGPGYPGVHQFEGTITAQDSGEFALALRVIPQHSHLTQAHELRLIRWM
jgi:starch phosphorylase